ncbi:MAG: DUF2330 domain-containing protein [Myxococcales bacterium]|nr:DUF2330 domain-containing protein [Myxococcales bacterium]MDP3505148.1 DUF2330 domain-containing protein [Myxococcales bacterium]
MIKTISTILLTATVAVATWAGRADACGCFAPPDPSVPIVQAGERILFATSNGKVTAHIQIQYAGDAKDFGWLLPMPSVPTLKLGTEELFTQLIATTQPRYFVQVRATGNCSNGFGGFGALAPSARGGVNDAENDGNGSPLVIQSSIGPYDYAVLKADNKDAMLKWLADNRYFIPVGTEDVVGPYINPGSFFLALKLQSGKSAGDIQPVVLEYPSEKPMIPIILTSVAAQPNMGIQVWMLGQGRAIPRNYRHVVINDAQLDWLNQARNYNDVVIKAISEAPEKHAFITEYAGSSDVMKDVLDPASRFGTQDALAAKTDPGAFVKHLFDTGFIPVPANQQQSGRGFPFQQQVLPPNLKALVLAAIPFPTDLKGVTTEDEFLRRLSYYLGEYRTNNPARFIGYQLAFNPSALAGEIFEKIVKPVREAGALLRAYPTLTRLYTALSPQDMTRDPVFSYNPSLPDVPRDHNATYEVNCGVAGNTFTSPGRLITEQGWSIKYPEGQNASPERALTAGPSALRVETLAEEGSPVVELDNSKPIATLSGCSVVDPAGLGLLALVAFLRRRRAS